MINQLKSYCLFFSVMIMAIITAGLMFWVSTMVQTGGMPKFAYQEDTGMGILYSPTHWRPATKSNGKIIYRDDDEG
jgi:hypothetical protein